MLAKTMDRMFDYLNRYYLTNLSLKYLGETAMELFKTKFYEKVKDNLRHAILDAFRQDRNQNEQDKQLLKKVITCYVHMGLAAAKPQRAQDKFYWSGSTNLTFYEQEFEATFLTASKEEYDKKAANWINECNAPEYLHYADEAFQHEENYC